tara:strand:- start:668 stop:1606 length:939 start_codon:yes stop_codon:yes gene_type:complete
MKNIDEKKIILHIGLHKTGSTFIQSHLNLINDDNYRIYLKKSQIVILIIKYLKEPSDNNKEEILSIINKEERKNILISSEEIFEKPNHEFKDVSKRFKLLEEVFNKPRYIIFFREPSSIIYSGYFQGLKKSHSLKFENFVNKNINDHKNRNSYNHWARGLDYKIYNYNHILKDYLKIKDRVLLIEYEEFFKEKKESILNNFIGFNIRFNWNLRENIALKNLSHLEFYNKYLFFRLLKFFWIKINKPFYKFKSANDISIRVLVLINFLNKFTSQKHLKKIEDEHQKILKDIKDYHSKNYNEFKNRLKPDINLM